MTVPITPEECMGSIPEEVIKLVNLILKKRGGSGRVKIWQEELVEGLSPHFSKQEIYGSHMLDFESLYRNAGWKVQYNKGSQVPDDVSHWIFSK